MRACAHMPLQKRNFIEINPGDIQLTLELSLEAALRGTCFTALPCKARLKGKSPHAGYNRGLRIAVLFYRE